MEDSDERSAPAVASDNGVYCRLQSGAPLHETYVRDQIDSNRSVTDLHLTCDDGHVPVHRFIMMGSSQFIKDVLKDHDPSELAVIHLPEVKLAHIVQIVSLVYGGKAVISKNDQAHLFSTMKSLGMSTSNFEFRSSKPTDFVLIPKLRYYKKDEEEIGDEMEETFVDESLITDVALPQIIQYSIPIPSGSINEVTVVGKENAAPEKTGPKVLSRSHIEQADTAKFRSLKLELPDENSESDDEFSCSTCNLPFSSEESLGQHLLSKCASSLSSKYDFVARQCNICNKKFPSYSKFGLLRHVQDCKGKKRTESSSSDEVSEVTIRFECDESLDTSLDPDPSQPGASSTLEGDAAPRANGLELESEAEIPLKLKKKRRRRRIAAYNLPKRKPKKKSSLTSAKTKEPKPQKDTQDESQKVDEAKDDVVEPNKDSVTDDEVETIEKETSKKSNSNHEKFNPNILVVSNPNLLREKYGISAMSDITGLGNDDLQKLFRQCPLCDKMFDKLRDVSKCLRHHGHRICFVCLKILPYKNNEIDTHMTQEHHNADGSEGKTECPLCFKEFEYKLGLPGHIGNLNCFFLTKEDIDSEDKKKSSKAVETSESNRNASTNSENTVRVSVNGASRSSSIKSLSKDSNLENNTPSDSSTTKPLPPLSIDNDTESSKLRNILTSPAPSPPIRVSQSSDTTVKSGSEKKIVAKTLEIQKDPKIQDRKSLSMPGQEVTTNKKKRRASDVIQQVPCSSSMLRDGHRSLSLEKQLGPPTTPSASEIEPPQEQVKVPAAIEPVQEGGPSVPSGMRFLTQKVICGEVFNIYCNADNKKRIAIPAPKKSLKES